MIHKIERGESSPTAVLLVRLAAAFGLTLSTLLARAEGQQTGRVLRNKDQPRWQDPETGYQRQQVAPVPGSDLPVEIIRVSLPAGARIALPAASYTFARQLMWILSGSMTFTEGGLVHELAEGDCLELGPPSDCIFHNQTDQPCLYAVVLLKN